MSITVFFISCGKKSQELNFSKFEIKDQTDVVGISVNDQGIIYSSGEETGKVERNGEIKTKEGKIVATINASGELFDSKRKLLVKINKQGDIDNGSGLIIHWDKNGNLLKGSEKTGMSISPNDSTSYRAASIVLFLNLNF